MNVECELLLLQLHCIALELGDPGIARHSSTAMSAEALRALYDALNVRVPATTAPPPAPPPQARTRREPVTLRMGAASSNPRVSPTLELTLPDDLWASAEARDLLESLAQNM